MRAETISKVHDFTLEARALLQKEVEEQLEGIYGLLPNGRWEPADRYPALQQIEEAKVTRSRLEHFLRDEQAAGVQPADARDKLVREAAFTWLNRLVAFKMMEARGLIRQSVSKGPQSNMFKFWLTEPGNETHYEKYEKGDLPQNPRGEGPRQEAYRHFLLWQCGQLAREIRVLFDPDDLASRLCPRPRALAQLIEWMNAPDLEEAWAPGNEETIGWVYQYFHEKEKKEVFERLYREKKKIRKEDIPAATELFTPRWIVTWLVHNSLGRYWLQMHPDSTLADRLEYLVPLAGDVPPVPLKKVREIKMLDPACGTMHFGLVAFDLFAEMYREELAKAGTPGWPAEPSVSREEEIPAAIIGHNLYGLDIDLRAVQLAALALYLKAKSLNRDAQIRESHLACASVLPFDKAKFSHFLEDLRAKNAIYARIFEGMWEHLRDLEQAGSLKRLEVRLRGLIAEERKKLGNQLPLLLGVSPQEWEANGGRLEFWDAVEKQLIGVLHDFYQAQKNQGQDESLFTLETQKGFQVLDIMRRRYDLVATNPPYMSRRNMNECLAAFLAREYPYSKGDLYAAFIERCAELLQEQGRLGMITQQSFMFISSYEKMRGELLSQHAIETMCHVGPRAFETISGEKVNTTLFILRREPRSEQRQAAVGTYFRLVKEPDGESKRRRFEVALAKVKAGEDDPLVYRYRQSDFPAIPGSPWVYWINNSLRSLFENLPKLQDLAPPRQGLATSDNFRFLRYWWETGISNIAFDCQDSNDAINSKKKWFPHIKGGGFNRWYGNLEYVVNWLHDGRELKSIVPASVIRNPDCYFLEGLTYSRVGSATLNTRLSPQGFIFDSGAVSIFRCDTFLFLAIMNSKIANYFARLINPTINFQVGDIKRIPICLNKSENLKEYVKEAILLAKRKTQQEENTYEFICPPDWLKGIEERATLYKLEVEVQGKIDQEVYRLYEISEADREAIEDELAEAKIAEEETDEGENESETASPEETTEEAPLTQEDLARQWLSYAVGIVLGRFAPGVEGALGRGNFAPEVAAQLRALASPEGILVMDEGHPDDLTARVLKALTLMVGEEEVAPLVQAATGKGGPPEELLRQYLEREFFKRHIQQYRKRPVYWFLQSPRKKYGLWLFHEKLTADTLLRLRSHYVEPKINLLQSRLKELQGQRDRAEGRERRRLQKKIEEIQDLLEDVRQFNKHLTFISEVRGYRPHLDDGVLLNMAPLWELIPSWQAEPKKAWQELEAGKYDWAYQAMDHWPERVREKCKTNKSYAIAHGLDFE
ncbi:MAG: BREX-1 system adenine-specific DNA-methyltransferase PglX [Desulfobaccales bacterium]